MAGRTSLVRFWTRAVQIQTRSVLVTDEVVLELLKLDVVALEGQRPSCKTNVTFITHSILSICLANIFENNVLGVVFSWHFFLIDLDEALLNDIESSFFINFAIVLRSISTFIYSFNEMHTSLDANRVYWLTIKSTTSFLTLFDLIIFAPNFEEYHLNLLLLSLNI